MIILTIFLFSGLSKPKTGTQARFNNQALQLVKNGNEMIFLEEEEYLDPSDPKLGKVYTYKNPTFFGHEFKILRDFSPDFISKLRTILNENPVDLIQISHPSGILAVKIVTKFKNKHVKLVYDAHNVESEFVDELIGEISLPGIYKVFLPLYVKLIEYLTVKLVDHVTCVSGKDKKTLVNKYSLNGKKIDIIPSGSSFLKTKTVELIKNENSNKCAKKDKKSIKKDWNVDPAKVIILFHGSFSHPPNREAVDIITRKIAPKLLEVHEALFILAGTGIPKFEEANVKSIGFVKDLPDLMNMVDIALVPLKKGGGTKLKVLDYLGAGLPIVTTEKGIEGIDVTNKKNALIVHNLSETIDSLKFLIDNENERNKMGLNAFKLAEKHYNWIKIGKKLDDVYKRLLED